MNLLLKQKKAEKAAEKAAKKAEKESKKESKKGKKSTKKTKSTNDEDVSVSHQYSLRHRYKIAQYLDD